MNPDIPPGKSNFHRSNQSIKKLVGEPSQVQRLPEKRPG